MSQTILSHFPRKDNLKMKEPDWESLPIIAIAIAGIIGAVLVYNNIHKIIASDELPEVHAQPIYIVEELSGGHETVEVETAEKVSEEIETPIEKKPILSDEEIAAKVVHAEAKGEKLLGQVLVAYTILNRCDYYGETVETVVKKPGQYSYDENIRPNPSCYRAVIIAEFIKDFIPDLLPDTLMWFANDGYHEDCGEPYIQVGRHYFNYLPEREE